MDLLCRSTHRDMTIVAAVCAAMAFVALTFSRLPAADEKSDPSKRFMRKKLDDSSKILEGLTVNDAEMIKKATQNLLKMTTSDLWNVILDEDYRELNGEFRSSLRKLEEAATNNNFDNALIQWFDATKGCMECHKHVRDVRAKLRPQ